MLLKLRKKKELKNPVQSVLQQSGRNPPYTVKIFRIVRNIPAFSTADIVHNRRRGSISLLKHPRIGQPNEAKPALRYRQSDVIGTMMNSRANRPVIVDFGMVASVRYAIDEARPIR